MNSEITHKMIDIQQDINHNLEHSNIASLVRIQTDKCYQHIPSFYFEN